MQKKTIALIAHDNKKAEMVSWAMKNREVLRSEATSKSVRKSRKDRLTS